jgi:hypothetical protein
MLVVRFYIRLHGKEYFNVERHHSLEDAILRARALGWEVVEVIECCES